MKKQLSSQNQTPFAVALGQPEVMAVQSMPNEVRQPIALKLAMAFDAQKPTFRSLERRLRRLRRFS